MAASKNNQSTSDNSTRNNIRHHGNNHGSNRGNQGGNIIDDDNSVHCVSYNIPSPHHTFNSAGSVSPPQQSRYTTLHEIDNTINLDNYNPGPIGLVEDDSELPNEYSDSVESIESDDAQTPGNGVDDPIVGFSNHNHRHNRRRSPVQRRRNSSVTYDPPMSPVYGSGTVTYNAGSSREVRGRRETRTRHNEQEGGRGRENRSRSPPTVPSTRQTGSRRLNNQNSTAASTSGRRRNHQNQNNFENEYDGGRGSQQTTTTVDDGLVLRIGVSQTVSDSSASVSGSSSSTDSDTD